MKPPGLVLLIGFALLVPKLAPSAGLPPWQFGMSREQVVSFKQFGPYKSFPNGDLETYNRQFHGKNENIQFFFVKNKLHHIGIYLGEGMDRQRTMAVLDRV